MGVILPSSNRVVERVTHDILSFVPGVDACFARIPISETDKASPPIVMTKSHSWLPPNFSVMPASMSSAGTRRAVLLIGFSHDRKLWVQLEQHTGLPVVTTAFSAFEAFAHFNIRHIALVTTVRRSKAPYSKRSC